MTRVAILVLNWNGVADTLACIDSLLLQSYQNFHIVIIDNGSRDDSVKQFEKRQQDDIDKITILCNPKNLGFSGGVNTGITWALKSKYDLVALFNNDALANREWLSHLVAAFDKKDVGIVTGLLLDENGKTIDSTGEQYSIWGMPFPRKRNNKKTEAPNSELVFGATGGASIYRVDMLREIGLFDESFFAYYEDTDISFRAQLAGWKITYEAKAIAYHRRGATSNKIPGFTTYQNFKNLPLLFWKNVPTKFLLILGSRFLLLYSLIFINAIKTGSGWPALKGILASIYYFWTSALWKRFKIQHSKKVSADYIWSILYHDLPPEQTGMRKFRKLFMGKD